MCFLGALVTLQILTCSGYWLKNEGPCEQAILIPKVDMEVEMGRKEITKSDDRCL